MFEVKELETNYINTSVCAIYDGNKYAIGFGPGLEAPKCVMNRTLQGEEQGHMEDIFGKNVKGRDGMIWTLSQERLHRCEGEELAVMTALTRIVSKEIYDK